MNPFSWSPSPVPEEFTTSVEVLDSRGRLLMVAPEEEALKQGLSITMLCLLAVDWAPPRPGAPR